MSDRHVTRIKGGVVVMVVICAHVPMSLRARTSMLDLWSENKGNEKEWIWVDEHADWDS